MIKEATEKGPGFFSLFVHPSVIHATERKFRDSGKFTKKYPSYAGGCNKNPGYIKDYFLLVYDSLEHLRERENGR